MIDESTGAAIILTWFIVIPAVLALSGKAGKVKRRESEWLARVLK